jgi:glycosyltransferase involved in cell wall biosynthesis
MVRNEANGYLASALDAWSEIADDILVLDDGSMDSTRDLLDSRGVHVLEHDGPKAWGNEFAPRKVLWDVAMESGHDWVLILDADMVPAKPVKELLENGTDGIVFYLYDLWSPNRYREDRFWRAHKVPRLWAFRNRSSTSKNIWSARGIHCGHAPQNLNLQRTLLAPRDYSLLHYGYADPVDRESKYIRYMSEGHQLSLNEWMHAQSIVDELPRTLPLDVDVTWKLRKPSS